MIQNADGTVTLTKAEMKSLTKMVSNVHDAISQLPSDGDMLGWDNYYALQMWEDKLKGTPGQDLEWYIDEEEDEENISRKKKPKTVDEWLEAYGKKK